MKRKTVWIVLLMLLASYAVPALAAPSAVPLLQGESVSGSYGDPNDLYLSYTVSGADFSQDTDGDPHVVGRYTGAAIHFSGKMIVTRPEGFLSYVSMGASLGDQSVQWPKEGEDNAVSGKTVEVPFDFTFQVPPDYDSQWVTGSAFVQACGGVCDSYSINLTIELPTATPTPTPMPAPESPCAEPMFFFPGMELNGYFTGHQPLRFSGEQMSADLGGALRRYIDEGNEVDTGVSFTDVHNVAKAFISSALPTGNEAALQNAARQLAQEKQQTDPNYRLTPGDLLYISLKQNNGNVRDALVTCHAALYRDGAGVNKKFIEQENILSPLRNPEGYADGEWTYKTPRGSERTINPRQELSGDEQGVWYHFFGLAALEFSDGSGSASYYAAWLTIWAGGLPENYTDQVIERGFPISNMGGALGDMAIALEHNVRSNMGKPPDIAKYCINYYALAAGSGLKNIMWDYYDKKPKPFNDKFGNFDTAGDILTPEGVVIYKSPLSILIQGVNGEWFSFDQRSAAVDGNTPAIYFEIFPEDDGTLGFLGVPFFEVASLEMTGAGEGPVTVGLYDRGSEQSSVFEFDVQDGDQIVVEGLTGTPLLNGTPLAASEQTAGTLPSGSSSNNRLGVLLIIAGGGLLAILLMGVLAVFVINKARRPSARPAPIQRQAGYAGTASCPHCGSMVSPGARFCGSCGQSIAPVAPPPSYAARPAAVSHPSMPGTADADATIINPGFGPAASPSQWQLVVEDGPNADQRHLLGPQTRLGRNPDNDVQLSDSQASRHHALVQREGDGYVLRDLNSSNGILVNGLRVGEPTQLQPGDVIQIGQTTFKVLGP